MSKCDAGDNGGYSMLTSDVALIVRPPRNVCPNRWVSTATVQPAVTVNYPTAAPSSCTSSSDDYNYYPVVVGLSICSGLLFITTLVFAMMWWIAMFASGEKMALQENKV